MRKRRLRVESFVKGRPRVMVKSVDKEGVAKENEVITETSTPYQINPGLTRRRAKELYILYYWTKEQLLELGMPERTLNQWLYEPTEGQLSWKAERDIFEATTFERMKERSSDEMSKGLARCMSILNRSLTEADLDGMKLKSPREYKDMVGVVKELKNLINVEEGKPTSITQNLSLTQAEVRDLVGELQDLDPLIDYDQSGKIN